MPFFLRRARLDSGEIFPVLYPGNPEQPILLPFLYVVLARRHKAVKTIEGDLNVICWLYE